MKITKDVDYAIRTVLYLSLSKNLSATKKEIADKMKIPPLYLAKIAQMLHKSRIMEISQGPKGKYQLIKDPKDITLLDVIEAIKGRIFLNYCVEGEDRCFRQDNCEVNKIWNELTEIVRNYLQDKNFKDLANKEICYLKNN